MCYEIGQQGFVCKANGNRLYDVYKRLYLFIKKWLY